MSRDRLVALLWPETSEDRARHSLSNALHVLRRTIGEDAIETPGDDIGLRNGVECDVWTFLEAIEREAWEEAAKTYAGPLLDAFHLPGADEFERWAATERANLEHDYGRALEALAGRAAERGDFTDAARGWERRLHLDPASARATLGLMKALVASGDRAEAIRRGEAHATILDEELGAPPDPAVESLLAQLRGELPQLHPAFHPEAARAARDGPPTIAVLPFENLAGPTGTLLVDGLANDILTRLSKRAGARVVSRTSTLRFRDRPGSLPEIGLALGATYVLEGSVQRDGERIRVTAQLIDASSDEHVWAERYDRSAADALALQDDVAERIADAVGEPLGLDPAADAVAPPRYDEETTRLFQQARELVARRRREEIEEAVGLYERAIDRDPRFAEAHAHLAQALWMLHREHEVPGAVERARKASEAAIELDAGSPEAHIAHAVIEWTEGDFETAERAFRRAIEVQPSHVLAHQWYAILLAGMGRIEDSLREILTALSLDPLNPLLRYNVGIKYYLARDYEGAETWFARALEIDPAWVPAHVVTAIVRLLRGDLDGARESLARANELDPDEPEAALVGAAVHAASGEPEEARRAFERGVELEGNPYDVGVTRLALGDVEGALDDLARADWELLARPMRWDPRLDPIRTHPRFLRFFESET